MSFVKRIRAAVAALAVTVAGGHAQAAGEANTKNPSGLPIPRYVSLKPDRVSVRVGPGKNYDVTWVYTRAGLPVEITAEFETWRRIRDGEGAEGWVYHSLLSGRRSAVVVPKSKNELVPLHAKGDPASAVEAQLQAGVLGAVKRCTDGWCRLTGDGFDGWVQQERLWGVYPDEKVD
jgi:SH3-like domain-containing protein